MTGVLIGGNLGHTHREERSLEGPGSLPKRMKTRNSDRSRKISFLSGKETVTVGRTGKTWTYRWSGG